MKKVFHAKSSANEQGWHRNTDYGCDLKTILHNDRTMRTGRDYQGVLRRDEDGCLDDFRCQDAHYTFVETLPWMGKRNPRVFVGEYITITRRDDGTLRPNFKPMKVDKHFSVGTYAFKVYLELGKALKGLIEK